MRSSRPSVWLSKEPRLLAVEARRVTGDTALVPKKQVRDEGNTDTVGLLPHQDRYHRALRKYVRHEANCHCLHACGKQKSKSPLLLERFCYTREIPARATRHESRWSSVQKYLTYHTIVEASEIAFAVGIRNDSHENKHPSHRTRRMRHFGSQSQGLTRQFSPKPLETAWLTVHWSSSDDKLSLSRLKNAQRQPRRGKKAGARARQGKKLSTAGILQQQRQPEAAQGRDRQRSETPCLAKQR